MGGARGGRYWDVAERPMRLMERIDKPNGLYPIFINPRFATWTSKKVAFGALGDSFYEYLIKQWLITHKKETWLRKMFDDAMFHMARLLVQRSRPSGQVIMRWTTGFPPCATARRALACTYPRRRRTTHSYLHDEMRSASAHAGVHR